MAPKRQAAKKDTRKAAPTKKSPAPTPQRNKKRAATAPAEKTPAKKRKTNFDNRSVLLPQASTGRVLRNRVVHGAEMNTNEVSHFDRETARFVEYEPQSVASESSEESDHEEKTFIEEPESPASEGSETSVSDEQETIEKPTPRDVQNHDAAEASDNAYINAMSQPEYGDPTAHHASPSPTSSQEASVDGETDDSLDDNETEQDDDVEQNDAVEKKDTVESASIAEQAQWRKDAEAIHQAIMKSNEPGPREYTAEDYEKMKELLLQDRRHKGVRWYSLQEIKHAAWQMIWLHIYIEEALRQWTRPTSKEKALRLYHSQLRMVFKRIPQLLLVKDLTKAEKKQKERLVERIAHHMVAFSKDPEKVPGVFETDELWELLKICYRSMPFEPPMVWGVRKASELQRP